MITGTYQIHSCLAFLTECLGRVVNTPASYLFVVYLTTLFRQLRLTASNERVIRE
jgi:hypothetical protein